MTILTKAQTGITYNIQTAFKHQFCEKPVQITVDYDTERQQRQKQLSKQQDICHKHSMFIFTVFVLLRDVKRIPATSLRA